MKLWRLVKYLLAVMVLLFSILWLIYRREFEPSIAVLGAIIVLGDLLFARQDSDSHRSMVPSGSWWQAVSEIAQSIRHGWSRIPPGSKAGSKVSAYECLGNAAMHAFGRVQHDAVAAALQVGVLLTLGGLWVSAMAAYDSGLQPWRLVGLVWFGLVILPPIAGSLPQQQERRVYKKLNPTKSQQLWLWLNKAVGVYASAFLGEAAAVLLWLFLNYVGVWSKLTWATRAVYWSVAALLSCFLGFVGSVIAVRYAWNLAKRGPAPKLRWQDFLLGFGFPLIIYPALIFFVWDTVELWKRWWLGCPVISVMTLVLAWLIRREARHGEQQERDRSDRS